MTTVDWTARLSKAVAEAEAAVSYRTKLLNQLRENAKAGRSAPFVRFAPDEEDRWHVWIPPHAEHHFQPGTVTAGPPFGDSYFDTLEEASTFLHQTVEWLADGEPPSPLDAPPAWHGTEPAFLAYTVEPARWRLDFHEDSQTGEAWALALEVAQPGQPTALLHMDDVQALRLGKALIMQVGVGNERFSK